MQREIDVISEIVRDNRGVDFEILHRSPSRIFGFLTFRNGYRFCISSYNYENKCFSINRVEITPNEFPYPIGCDPDHIMNRWILNPGECRLGTYFWDKESLRIEINRISELSFETKIAT